MKNSRKKNHKAQYITLAILLLIALSIGGYYLSSVRSKNNQTNDSKKTPQSQLDDNNAPDEIDETSVIEKTPTVDNRTNEEIDTSQVGSISITELIQANGFINASAAVSNFSTENCVYSFTRQDARPVFREIAGDCIKVSIPEAELEMIGTYKLTVTAYSGETKLTATKDIEVR